MGVDRHERDKKPEKFKMSGPRIWIPLDVLQGSAWASLSYPACKLLLDLAAQLRTKNGGDISNNGALTTALTVLQTRGWTRRGTILKAAEELERVGLICKTRQGQFPSVPSLYAVTWLPLNESKQLDVTAKGYPFHAYRLQDPPPMIKNAASCTPSVTMRVQ